MKQFLNIVAVMLLAAWAVSLLFDVGSLAHVMLILAILIMLFNIIWTTLRTK